MAEQRAAYGPAEAGVPRGGAAEAGAPAEADWLVALRAACAAEGQATVARRLRQADGYPSDPLVYRVLRGSYPHPTERLADLVRGVLLASTVACPIHGALRLDVCQQWQRRPYSSGSPLAVQMYRACRACPNREAAA
jgi:hypothetical protein